MHLASAVSGGRSWWAHRQYTRINIELTTLPEKVEDYLHFLESVCLLASFQPFARARHVLAVSGRRCKSQESSPRLRGGGNSGGRTCAFAKGESLYGIFGVVGDFACSNRTSSALRSAALEKVPRDNVMRRVLPVLRWTTSAAHADFWHQQEPSCHGRPAAASALVTSSVHCFSVTGGTVTELSPRDYH